MADKQTLEDKAAAMREYQDHQRSIRERTAVLRSERLEREAAESVELEKPALPRRQRSSRAH